VERARGVQGRGEAAQHSTHSTQHSTAKAKAKAKAATNSETIK